MIQSDHVIPLYHRIYVVLLQKIDEGSYPPGQAIPSEDDLSAAFKVSRITIRRAMERLEREGRVIRQRGRGTFPLPSKYDENHVEHKRLLNQLSLGKTTTIKLHDYGLIPASPEIARQLALGDGSTVLRIIRVRSDGASLLSYTRAYMPESIGESIRKSEMNDSPLSFILRENGVSIRNFRDRISTALADTEIAEVLSVDVGTALVKMLRTVFNSSGIPVLYLEAYLRPDRYEYVVEYSADDESKSAIFQAASVAFVD